MHNLSITEHVRCTVVDLTHNNCVATDSDGKLFMCRIKCLTNEIRKILKFPYNTPNFQNKVSLPELSMPCGSTAIQYQFHPKVEPN